MRCSVLEERYLEFAQTAWNVSVKCNHMMIIRNRERLSRSGGKKESACFDPNLPACSILICVLFAQEQLHGSCGGAPNHARARSLGMLRQLEKGLLMGALSVRPSGRGVIRLCCASRMIRRYMIHAKLTHSRRTGKHIGAIVVRGPRAQDFGSSEHKSHS